MSSFFDNSHYALNRARANGGLPTDPPACEVCGVAGERKRKSWSVVYHHWSYLPQHFLDVTALCRSCHSKVHRGTLPEPIPNLYADPLVTHRGPEVVVEALEARAQGTVAPPRKPAPRAVSPKVKPAPRPPAKPKARPSTGTTPFERFGHMRLPSRPPPRGDS